MALPSGAFLKQPSPLAQLLEEINFQRTKEMRQLMKDDSGFVVLQGTTYWTDLFVRHFLFQAEPVHNIDSDDLLFFVRKKHVKGTSRHMPKFETEVDVYRKDSRKLPIGDPDVDWEETVYLNMVIHQFNYTLTLAICTRTSPKELQVLRRHSQRVYASPSRRKMDTKGENEEMTYPHICFMVDNFDEVFSDILVRDGEMVCVELVASDKDGAVQGVIFLGSIRYDALKKVYDARQSSLSSKVAQRMTFGLFSSGAGVQTRCEFVRMKGPQGKGHAEMAVTKPKGSGVETPTSEPGFCATEMLDGWEEDPDEYFTRHQRRLSDPSANLNNFSRYGWKYAKNIEQCSGSKARSENEGLDSLANEVSEIEAGDLRDDRGPASSASQQTNKINDNLDVNKINETNCEFSANLITSTNSTIITDITTNAYVTATSNTTNINTLTVTDSIETSFISSCSTSEKIKTNISIKENSKSVDNDRNLKQKSSQDNVIPVKMVEDSVIKSPPSSGYCCTSCFSPNKCKRWSDTDSAQMSDIYSRSIGSISNNDVANETPACLEKFPTKKSRQNTNYNNNNKFKESKLSGTETFRKRTSLRTTSLPRSKSLAGTSNVPTLKKDNSKKSIFTNSLKKDPKIEKNNNHKLVSSIKKKNLSISSNATGCTTNNAKKVISNKVNIKTKNNDSNVGNNKTINSTKDAKEKINLNQFEEYEIGDDVTSLNEEQIVATNINETEKVKICVLNENDSERIRVHGKEELPVVQTPTKITSKTNISEQDNNKNQRQAINTMTNSIDKFVPIETKCHPLEPAITIKTSNTKFIETSIIHMNKIEESQNKNKIEAESENDENITENSKLLGDYNGNNNVNNCNNNSIHAVDVNPTLSNNNELAIIALDNTDILSNSSNNNLQRTRSLPGIRGVYTRNRSLSNSERYQNVHDKLLKIVPKHVTPDGTTIYYWCDLISKKSPKELDDGAYNPLWASRGFTQQFHFWKENRRQQSTPLNAFLTYVTLPWWSIAKDLLDHRETPILTF